jgi:hypothetical protein
MVDRANEQFGGLSAIILNVGVSGAGGIAGPELTRRRCPRSKKGMRNRQLNRKRGAKAVLTGQGDQSPIGVCDWRTLDTVDETLCSLGSCSQASREI